MLNLENHGSNRLVVPKWIAERIRTTNYTLIDHMYLSLKSKDSLRSVFDTTSENLTTLRSSTAARQQLLDSPFLLVVPVLESVDDWKSLLNERPNANAEALAARMPQLDNVSQLNLYHQNKIYVSLLIDVLNISILAAPICGISIELALYLSQVTQHTLELAIARATFPLFRWRFNTRDFWFDLSNEKLDEDCLAHHLMMQSPVRTDALDGRAIWSDSRFKRVENQIYADHFLKLGARASTVSSLFHINHSFTRPAFKQHHGVSSPVGKLPTSPQWYVGKARNRIQSSMWTWLYRSALAAGGNVADAHIASTALCKQHFRDNFLISLDRACNLSKTMAADSTLAIAPCRSCGTPYLIANNEATVELPHLFKCPACTGSLFSKRGPGRKTLAPRRIDL